jgi:hypothetical protein
MPDILSRGFLYPTVKQAACIADVLRSFARIASKVRAGASTGSAGDDWEDIQ